MKTFVYTKDNWPILLEREDHSESTNEWKLQIISTLERQCLTYISIQLCFIYLCLLTLRIVAGGKVQLVRVTRKNKNLSRSNNVRGKFMATKSKPENKGFRTWMTKLLHIRLKTTNWFHGKQVFQDHNGYNNFLL